MGIERLNALLYESRGPVLRLARAANILASLTALGLILYQSGFYLTNKHLLWTDRGMHLIYIVFAVSYFVRLLYNFRRWDFLKSTWFEGLLMAVIVASGISHYFFDHSLFRSLFRDLGVESYKEVYRLLLIGTMLYIVAVEFVKVSTFLNRLRLKPATTFLFSFLLLVLIGTGLLMLPRMTPGHGHLSFFDAIFTSTSASCVTGLIIVDTATAFTFKGQLVILILMQLGGIGMVSFATFFATFLKRGVGLKHQAMLQDIMATESLFSAKGLLRRVIGVTLTVEVVAAVCIYFTWGPEVHFESNGQRIFFSIFHSVSAFCNAGFSLFTNGLSEAGVQTSHLLHIIIAGAIILGGLGFSTIQDVFSVRKLRERLAMPWKDWLLSSKIAIYSSLLLITFGTIMFFVLERNNQGSIGEMGVMEQMVASLFQSVTTRTAGFNTVDFSALATPTLVLFIFMMFIGGSSGGTAGGIKTSTFMIISVSAIAAIRGRKVVQFSKRTISTELIYRALSIFVFAASFNLIMIFLLTITDGNQDILFLVFEQISAFGTVGLSCGITDDLSTGGQVLIMISMFVGRIGTLTLALALSSGAISNNYSYPTAHIMVG